MGNIVVRHTQFVTKRTVLTMDRASVVAFFRREFPHHRIPDEARFAVNDPGGTPLLSDLTIEWTEKESNCGG